MNRLVADINAKGVSLMLMLAPAGAGKLVAHSATAIPAGGTLGITVSSTANWLFFNQELTLSGSLYMRSDGTTTNNRCTSNQTAPRPGPP